MLNEAELNALREIERTLSADDPSLAAKLKSARVGRSVRRERLARDLIITLALLLALVCMISGQVGAGLVAALFAAVVLVLRCRRFRPRWPRRRAGGA